MTKRRKTRKIAPRLANGDSRMMWYGRLPEYIKVGIQAIAEHENESVSWVLEQVVIKYFRLRRPRYITDNKRK